MGPHSKYDNLFIEPINAINVNLSNNNTINLTLPNHSVNSKRTSSTKRTYSNELTTKNHKLKFRTGTAILTPPITPPIIASSSNSFCTADNHNHNHNHNHNNNNNNHDNNKSKLIVECQVRARIPTLTKGEFFLNLYKNNKDNKEHLTIIYGNDIRSKSLDRPRPGEKEIDRMIRGAYTGRLRPGQTKSDELGESINNISTNEQHSQQQSPLVRIHSECFTGETVHSARCDCGEQLEEAMRLIQSEGRGVIVYLRQEGRGIGLADKLRAYNLQDLGHDTVTANLLLHHSPDLRNYDIANQILKDLNLKSIRLLTNNPDKIKQINESGIKVVERIPMIPNLWKENNIATNSNNNSISSTSSISNISGSVSIGNNNSEELNKYLKVKVEKMRHLLNIPEILLK